VRPTARGEKRRNAFQLASRKRSCNRPIPPPAQKLQGKKGERQISERRIIQKGGCYPGVPGGKKNKTKEKKREVVFFQWKRGEKERGCQKGGFAFRSNAKKREKKKHCQTKNKRKTTPTKYGIALREVFDVLTCLTNKTTKGGRFPPKEERKKKGRAPFCPGPVIKERVGGVQSKF